MSLTLPPAEFTYLYSRAPDTSTFPPSPVTDARQPAGKKQTKQCAACLLQTIATSAAALIGLRSILLARLPLEVLEARKRSPRLEIIEGFMHVFGMEQASWMMGVSGRVGSEMRALIQEGQATAGNSLRSGRDESRCKPERPRRPGAGLACDEQLLQPRPEAGCESGLRVRNTLLREEQLPRVRYCTKPVAMVRESCIPPPLRIACKGDYGTGRMAALAR